MKILFVCHGNICRSVMAEMIFKHLDKDHLFEVDSCATSTEEIGNSIYPPVIEVLKFHNIPYYNHLARQITISDINKYDLIIAADYNNIRNLNRMFGETDKVYLLKHFIGMESEVSDPWYTRDFELCYKEIYTCCEALLKYLKERR